MGSVVAHPAVWTKPEESFKTGSSEKQRNMEAYVEWMLTPPGDREHKTKTAFAESLGVTLQTLRNYAKEAYVQREVAERARKVARVDKLPAVIENLYRIATGETESKPSEQVSASKALIDWLEKTSAARESTVDLSDVTSERLVEIAMEALNRAQES